MSGAKTEAVDLFKKASAIKTDGASSPDSLNTIAYGFSSAGQPDKGLILLRAAAELYPQNANLYDSLGDFSLKRGEKTEAIKFYKKALTIDPNSADAKRMLEILTNAQ